MILFFWRTSHERASNWALVDALRQGGAKIDYLEQTDYPPIRLRGGFLGGNVEVDGSVFSQF